MKKIIKLILFILIIGIALGAYWYLDGIKKPLDGQGKDVQFEVKVGENVSQIAANLENSGIIKSKLLFQMYLKINNKGNQIKAGNYLLSSQKNISEIVEIFEKGVVVKQELEIRLIEGWTIDNMQKYFIDNKILNDNSFAQLAKHRVDDWQFSFPKSELLNTIPRGVDLEGYLFPDTYRVYANSSAENIIKKLINTLDQKVTPEMRAEIAKQGKSVHKIMTMASIIQKEVRSESDMKIVSGIFWDRIKNGQALQSCATLAYILGENKPQYSYEDTQIDSPYNTYKNKDLPPGPIASPGQQAIIAAIYPEYTEYNYFLTANVEGYVGRTIWAKTYEEHLENKRKYIK